MSDRKHKRAVRFNAIVGKVFYRLYAFTNHGHFHHYLWVQFGQSFAFSDHAIIVGGYHLGAEIDALRDRALSNLQDKGEA